MLRNVLVSSSILLVASIGNTAEQPVVLPTARCSVSYEGKSVAVGLENMVVNSISTNFEISKAIKQKFESAKTLENQIFLFIEMDAGNNTGFIDTSKLTHLSARMVALTKSGFKPLASAILPFASVEALKLEHNGITLTCQMDK